MIGEEMDIVTFQILRHRTEEILAEMYYTLVRISGNPTLYEAGDHEEAILDAHGDTVIAGGGVVEWTTCLENGVKFLIQHFGEDPGFDDGDQWIHNYPYGAAVHGMDVQILKPIFWEGKLVAWSVTAGHQADIGGIDPGSFCIRANEMFQEGLLIKGLRIVEKGRMRKDVEETIRGMVRMPDAVMMGLVAAVGSNNVGESRIHDMIRRYGIDTVLTFFEEIKHYSEERIRQRISKIPDGQWHVDHYIESIIPEEKYLKVALTAVKEGDTVMFDYTGSSPQSKGSQNIGEIGAMSNAHCSWLTLMAYDIPWSSGAWKPLKFNMPKGTIVNPEFPAATSFNTPAGVGYTLITSSFDLLSRMLLCCEGEREEAFANSNAAIHGITVYGRDHLDKVCTFNLMDNLCGGQGAFCYRDGDSTWGNMWGPKTQICNVETNELHFPLLYLGRKEAKDMGGIGKYRGGNGLSIAVVPYGTPSEDIIIIDKGSGTEARMSIGLAGGYPAANTQGGVIRNTNIIDQLKRGWMPKSFEELGEIELFQTGQPFSINKKRGDILVAYINTGGGGYGDPLERDPALVLKDLIEENISLEAVRWYHVVIDPQKFEVDMKKTEEERREARNERINAGAKGNMI